MQFFAIVLSLIAFFGSHAPAPAWVAYADDASITYQGRWDDSTVTSPWCGWQGSSVSINFDGTAIAMGVIVENDNEWFKVIVDGDIFNAKEVEVSSKNSWQAVILAHGLTAGTHHIEVVKETNNNEHMTFLGFAGIDGIGPLSPPLPHSRRIAFYGDSNLAGDSLEHEENNGQLRYRGCTNTFAGITARRFGAAYQNCSISGATISSLNNWYDRVDPSDENTQWDFNNWMPDVVVINIGANDIYYYSESRIRTRYNNLLDDMRGTYPNAHIVMANGRGWDKDEPADYIESVVAQRNDPNMSAVIFPWVFEQWHGCETDHSGMADLVSEHIATVMGWTASPTDVMTGFGRGGNVANGSFEESAPFGGFGWRYGVNKPGVHRLYAPATAQDGEYFVGVVSGGSIQQSNPCQPGQTVTVNLWLRSTQAAGAALADITLDFRNQEMYTAPLSSTSFTLLARPTWTNHTVTAIAPVGGDPIFHTRLTIASNGQSQVAIDNVTMTIN